MAASKEVLRIAIEEQRLVAHKMNDDYYHMKARILAYLGGGFAALIFLYSRYDGKDAAFIPGEVYGKIFYFIALGLVLFAFSVLLYALTGSLWEVPTENVKLNSLSEVDEAKYLEYVKKRYVKCFKTNIRVYSSKQQMVNIAFYPLVFGVTMLVVINLFRG